MGDAIGGAAVFRQEIAALTGEVHRLQGDEAYQTAVAVRAKLQLPEARPPPPHRPPPRRGQT